jgi:Na+-driven multidrug efflux pump
VEQSVRALGFIAMTFLVTAFGTEMTAVYGVGTNVLQLMVIPALGISMATSTLAGQAIGARNPKRAEDIAWLSSVISFFLLSFLGLFVFIFAPAIVRFFVPNDPLVIEGGVRFIHIIAPSFGFLGFQMALSGVLRAAGSTFATMVLALVSLWGIQFPVAFILSRYTELGETGIWWAFPASYIIVSFMSLFWFIRGNWKKHRLTETEELEDIITEEILIEEGTR